MKLSWSYASKRNSNLKSITPYHDEITLFNMLIVRYGVNFRKIVNMDHVGGVKILYKSLVRLFNLYWLFGALLIDWQGCIGWSWKNFNTITAILKWQFRNNIILVGISFFVATLILT